MTAKEYLSQARYLDNRIKSKLLQIDSLNELATRCTPSYSDMPKSPIYADDGISGTNTKKREEFNHMIDDCKAGNIDMIITKSISRFASVIRASQATSVENIDEKLMALQQELIQKAQSKEAYDEIADEIFRLRELRQQTTVDTAARDEQIKRINDLQDYIAQQTTHLTEFDESLVRRWIKQITIWDDHITVELKSGVSIDVDA